MNFRHKIGKLLFGALMIMQNIHAQSNQIFHISGDISAKGKVYFYIQTIHHTTPFDIDSVNVSNGKLNYTGNTKQVAYYQIRYKNEQGKEFDDSFFTDSGAIHIQEDPNGFGLILSGTPSNDQFQSLQAQLKEYYQHAYPLTDSINEYSYQGSIAKNDEKSGNDLLFYQNKIKEFYKILEPWELKRRAIAIDFFFKNPQSYVTAKLATFYNGDLSKDSMMLIYKNLGEKIQNSDLGKELYTAIIGEKIAEVGSPAISFTNKDINGKSLSLSDYKGKYVLLDFWASWCVPCRAGNPHMIEQYKKYNKKGFEIIGISDDDRSIDKWKNAVAKDKINIWKHILRGANDKNALSGDGDLTRMYNVHGYPTKILVDPNGLIIGRYQSDAELDEKLEQIFK